MSINSILNMAQQALQVNQTAMSVVSNNISNMNTENYAKQRVNLAENPFYNKVSTLQGIAKVGSGVQIASITSYRDKYLDEYYRNENAGANFYNTLNSCAADIDNIFTDDLNGGGLSGAFAAFYDAAQKLTNDPTDETLRRNFIEQAQNVAQNFNSISTQLNSMKKNLVGDINDFSSIQSSKTNLSVDEINEKLASLAELNFKISKSQTEAGVPSALESEQAVLLDELSSLIPISTQYKENGTVEITFNNTTLVKGKEQLAQFDCAVGTVDEPCIIQLKDMDNNIIPGKSNINENISGGALGAYLQMGNLQTDGSLSIATVISQLNTLANEFATAINDIQTYNDGAEAAMAIDENNLLTAVPAENVIFFDNNQTTTNITAANISINTNLLTNPKLLAVARVAINPDGTAVEAEAIGNSNNAAAIIKTQTESLTGLNNTSPLSYYQSLVNTVASETGKISANATVTSSILSSIGNQRTSAMGVNLDEELVDLIKYQRAYESSARVFSAANEVYSILVNLGN